MRDFLEGCRRSGMVDLICEICGRPYLTRSFDTWCPPCREPDRFLDCWLCMTEGQHAAIDCPKMATRQRRRLLSVLVERAQPVLSIPNFWIDEVQVQDVETIPSRGGRITGVFTRRLGRLPPYHFDQVLPRRNFAPGTRIIAKMPAGDDCLLMFTTDDQKWHYMAAFTPALPARKRIKLCNPG